MVVSGHILASGAWRKSSYSSENAFTRHNKDFPLAKLARQLRCAALVLHMRPRTAEIALTPGWLLHPPEKDRPAREAV